VAGGGSNARQRARMQARLASRPARKALERADDDADREPHLKGSGRVEGSAFDWETNLYIDPDTKSLFDGGDLEARDIREALASDWKMRQLAELLTGTIKGATWKLVPGKGDTGEAEDTEEKLRRQANAGGMTTPMELVIAQAASSRIYRRAYFAKGFKIDPVKRDGSVMYSQLAFRPASTCRPRVDPVDGSFDGFVQEIVYYGDASGHGGKHWDGRPVVFTPRESVVFFNGLEKEPVSGISDLEVAMWCYRTKRKVMALWLTFLAAQALPRTLVKYTGGDEPKARKAAEMIASLSSGGVGYIDATGMDVALLDGSGKGPAVFKEMAEYLDTCQSGSILAGFTDLTAQAASGRGSYALHESATEMFDRATAHAATGVEGTFTNHAVADLVRYNYGPTGVCPTFKFDPLDSAAAGPLMSLLQALATTQSSALPQEFVNELAIHASRLLDLDVDKIGKALDQAAVRAKQQAEQQAANPAGHQAAAVNGAVEGLRGIAREVTRAA
jgi:hypothetical protein